MKIALMMENSQASKNAIIYNELSAVANEKGFPIFNVGMCDENDHHLTYIHLASWRVFCLMQTRLILWLLAVAPGRAR